MFFLGYYHFVKALVFLSGYLRFIVSNCFFLTRHMLVVLVCAISGSVSRLSFPGYVSTEAPPLASHSIPVSTGFPGASSDFLQRNVRSLLDGDFVLRKKSLLLNIYFRCCKFIVFGCR